MDEFKNGGIYESDCNIGLIFKVNRCIIVSIVFKEIKMDEFKMVLFNSNY